MPQHMPSGLRAPGHFASQIQSVMAYLCQMTSVKACGIRTTHTMAYAFRMTSTRAFYLPDAEFPGIFLPDDQCACICLLNTVRQGISIDGCYCIYFWTVLASAYTAPNLCWPCVCVLDKDRHRSSLLGDDCQSDAFSFCRRVSSMCHPDDTRYGMCFSDDEYHGILPSRCRVSGHISSRQ